MPFAAGGTEIEKVRLFFFQVCEEHVPTHLLRVVWVIFRPSVVFAEDRQPCIFFFLHLWPSSNAARNPPPLWLEAQGLGSRIFSQNLRRPVARSRQADFCLPRPEVDFKKHSRSAALIKQTTNKHQTKLLRSVRVNVSVACELINSRLAV